VKISIIEVFLCCDKVGDDICEISHSDMSDARMFICFGFENIIELSRRDIVDCPSFDLSGDLILEFVGLTCVFGSFIGSKNHL